MKSSREWISISDMMSGLMMIFLFIAILYMDQIRKKSDADIKRTKETISGINTIANKYVVIRKDIYEKLMEEFQKDLKRWNAEIVESLLIIKFLSPDIMFNPMKSRIKRKFKIILNDFCPRYFKVLHDFRKSIEEIRIEGHTSHEWYGATREQSYFHNMKLSQDRTRAVLQYCVKIKNVPNNISQWATKKLTANGLSFSRPVCKMDTVRCRTRNRRVEFRVQTNDFIMLDEIIKKIKHIFSIRSTTDSSRGISAK